jgi:glycosyltransferase involved in cell wall biosynthesis
MRIITGPILNLWKLLPSSIRGGSLLIKFKNSGIGSFVVNAIHGNRAPSKVVTAASTPLDDFYKIYDCAPLDSTLETVLLVIHASDRSGAPMLGLGLINTLKINFNVIVFVLNEGGPLMPLFKSSGAVAVVGANVLGRADLASSVMKIILEEFSIDFAIINSIESGHHVGKSFVDTSILPIYLIHEFASCYGNPREAVRNICSNPGVFIFSGQITLNDAEAHFSPIKERSCFVFPQGVSEIDFYLNVYEDRFTSQKSEFPVLKESNEKLVVGLGVVHYRKGVDLFIQTAIEFFKIHPSQNVKFIWIGKELDKGHSWSYYTLLKDQMQRSGFANKIELRDEVDNLNSIYDQTDFLLITSRLDPFPNVAIDAMKRGVPVLCFDNTTGVADYLKYEKLSSYLVSSYLDTKEMAQNLNYLLSNLNFTANISRQLSELASKKFNMKDYSQKIINIFHDYRGSYMRDLVLLQATKGVLDNSFFRTDDIDERCEKISLEELYLNSWRTSSIDRRKPVSGFNPAIYKELKKLSIDRDPFADFLAKNKPAGPWLKEIITPDVYRDLPLPPNSQIALHIHVHYFDEFEKFFDALKINTIRPDLFISATNHDLCFKINHTVKDYSGRVMALEVTPNRGRDLGPLLLGDMGSKIIANYEYFGHLHTKKTPHAPLKLSEAWTQFLIANLLGIEKINSADQILNYLITHPDVGLVFPDDPNILSWDANYSHARDLANSMHIETLPDYFNFPVGTMFWGRAKALTPLIELNLRFEDIPEEPLPIDGTMLHALERLLPFIAEKAGFDYALVNTGLVTR